MQWGASLNESDQREPFMIGAEPAATQRMLMMRAAGGSCLLRERKRKGKTERERESERERERERERARERARERERASERASERARARERERDRERDCIDTEDQRIDINTYNIHIYIYANI